MRVYLVPLASDRYELYCEAAHTPLEIDADVEGRGYWGGLLQRFHLMLDRIERDYRRQPVPIPPDAGKLRRWRLSARRRLVRWLAEKVSEQRVLWRLRGQQEVTAVHPSDLDEAAAMEIILRTLRQNVQRHGRWAVLYALAFIASGLVMFLPGPNLIAYYFAFLMVGHFLSRRGALDGLNTVNWRLESSQALAELRRVAGLAPCERRPHVQDIASRLGLEHLPSFFERVAVTLP
ncbi:MAG: hypothetical protein EHM13_07405 [Acidobacteria bacterium]|nr:MAG: hypothetical protein EHM13_07405 [Acidobacteriota bacterium]